MNGTSLPQLLGLEWFKLRKRPMPYVLLAVLAAFLLTNTFLTYLLVRLATLGGGALPPEARDVLLGTLLLPDALPAVFSNVQSLGAIMVIILTAVSFGGEFGWGTVRLLLGRGAGRNQFIISKTLVLAVWGLLFVVAGALVGIIGAVSIALFEGRSLGNTLGQLSAGAWPAMTARTWYTLVIYLLLTVFATVATRSTAAGMAIGLVYYFVEGLVGNLLGLFVEGWFARALQLLIGVNVQGLLRANGPPPRAADVSSNLPSAWQAALVLTLYCAGFLGSALLLFRRRDLMAGGGQ